jgi:hypothetical protein
MKGKSPAEATEELKKAGMEESKIKELLPHKVCKLIRALIL